MTETQGVLSHTRRQLLYDLLLGTALVSAGGAVTAGPAEAALVQMPTQRLKNRYYLVSAHLQEVYKCACLLYEVKHQQSVFDQL